jgi:IS5 family transposase
MRTRESRYVTVARLAYQLAQQTFPRYTCPKSPHRYSLPQRVACVLMKFYLDVSYRDAEEWLLASDQVQQVLELKQVPDYSTLIRTFGRLRQREWDQLLRTLLDGLKVEETAMSVDTTHFRLSQASAYFITRSGRQYREWVKGGYAVGVDSQLILGWRSGRGIGYDQPYLEPLRRQARRYGRYHQGSGTGCYSATWALTAKPRAPTTSSRRSGATTHSSLRPARRGKTWSMLPDSTASMDNAGSRKPSTR